MSFILGLFFEHDSAHFMLIQQEKMHFKMPLSCEKSSLFHANLNTNNKDAVEPVHQRCLTRTQVFRVLERIIAKLVTYILSTLYLVSVA